MNAAAANNNDEIPREYCGRVYERLGFSSLNAGVLECCLHRPSRLNTFDNLMWSEIADFFAAVKQDERVRVVLLTGGSSRHFTAGLDLQSAAGGIGGGGEEEEAARRALRIRHTGKEWQSSFTNMAKSGKPIITLAHGACIGAGVEMLSAADVRWCTRDCFFAMAEVDVGLAADVGGLQRFPKIVGNDSLVRELALSGRRFSSEEALRIGFVSRVCADREEMLREGRAIAGKIAGKSPLATLGVKTLLNYSRDHTIDDSLEYAITWNSALLQTDDMKVAAMAQMSKQEATFEDLPRIGRKEGKSKL